MDIVLNTEIRAKLLPKLDTAVRRQRLPMPIHLKENLIFELVLVHNYGIIAVLPFSHYASPIFGQKI